MDQPAVRSEGRGGPRSTPPIPPRSVVAPPSVPAVVFILLAVLVPLGLQQPLLNSDGDLARHLRHGRYMLEHGGLIHTDPFSFTRHGAPFVGFEYGSQLLYALAEQIGGLAGVTILAGLLIGLAYALVTRFLIRRGVDPLLAYLTTVLAAVVGVGHWVARPHLFSFVAVIVLLDLLERRAPSRVLPFVVLFIVWANLHGGFIFGWILIAIYLFGSVGEMLLGNARDHWKSMVGYYAKALAAAIGATLLNPHGLALHRHVIDFLGEQYIFDNTSEFMSPDFHELGAKLFLVVLLGCIAALGLKGSRPTLPRLLLLCAGTGFGLLAVRNMSLFGLTALPVLALHVDDAWRRLPDPAGVRGRFEQTAGRTSTLPWVLPVVVLLCGLALAHGRLGRLQLIDNRFDATVFPLAAVAKARNAHLEGNLFSEFAWGGYLIYAWPEQKIFIDGGTDFFGEEVFRGYSTIKRLSPGWRDVLKKWGISLILLRRESALTHELARDAVWNLWYCDSLAVVLRPSADTLAVTPAMADSAEHALNGCAKRSSGPLSDSHQ
jgi:hypothetical protein